MKTIGVVIFTTIIFLVACEKKEPAAKPVAIVSMHTSK